MANFKYFPLFFSIITVLSNAATAFGQAKYVPHSSEYSRNNTRTQASRTPLASQIDFELLAPKNQISATSLKFPIFYVLIHKLKTNEATLDVTIEDTSNGQIVASQVVKVSLGTNAIKISNPISDGRYILSVSHNCDVRCEGIRIAFDRKALSDSERATIRSLDKHQQAQFLAQKGYYYDSIRAEMENSGRSASHTNDALD